MVIALGSSDATLLDGVNYVLKKARLIQGDSGELTSLSDSPRQVWIDQIVQAWNETVEELYSVTGTPMPKELAEATITLVTDDRDYALASNLNILYWPFLNETNGQYIHESTGGYLALVARQPIPADYTGLPIYGTIRPTDGELYLDRIPTSSENGLVYKYRYDKDLSLSAVTDNFPFKNNIFRALVPAVTEIFNIYHRREFNDSLYSTSMGRAARLLSQKPIKTSYLPAKISMDNGVMNPFDG